MTCLSRTFVALAVLLGMGLSVAAQPRQFDIVLSDSGRNIAWHRGLVLNTKNATRIAFDAKGKDGEPVGGVLAGTQQEMQLLLAMPADEDQIDVKGVADHIYQELVSPVASKYPVFEIRLLQNAQPSDSAADIARRLKQHAPDLYKAIGQGIKRYRDEQGVDIRITVAVADTGVSAFTMSSEQWAPYADAFRRVDMVDGHASLQDARAVLKLVKPQQLRLFYASDSSCPSLSVGRPEVVKRLLEDNAGLIAYRFEAEGVSREKDKLLWFENLAGETMFKVTRIKKDVSGLSEEVLDFPIAPSQYRPPVGGWDPAINNTLLSITKDINQNNIAKNNDTLNSQVVLYAPDNDDSEDLSRLLAVNTGPGYTPTNNTQQMLSTSGNSYMRTSQPGNAIRAGVALAKTQPDVEVRIIATSEHMANLPRAEDGYYPPNLILVPVGITKKEGFSSTIKNGLDKLTNNTYADHENVILSKHSGAVIEPFKNHYDHKETTIYSPKLSITGTAGVQANLSASRAGPGARTAGAGSTIRKRGLSGGLSVAPALTLPYAEADYTMSYSLGGKKISGTLGDVLNARLVNKNAQATNFRFLRALPSTPAPYASQFKPIASLRPVKGVMLNAVAQFDGTSDTFQPTDIGLVFQGDTGEIDLPRLQMFTTAMWAAYFSVEGPGISIDPISENRGLDPFHEVRYIGQVKHLDIGRVMRETDYIMKQWATGTTRPNIPGFQTASEIKREIGDTERNRPSRFWILSDAMRFELSGNMMTFADGRMMVKTEYLDSKPGAKANPANEAFAQWFTGHYHESIAPKYPVFEDLFQYAQLTSIGTFLRESSMPMLWFLMANREMLLTEKSIEKLPELKRIETGTGIKIYGGVDMKSDGFVRESTNYTVKPQMGQARAIARSLAADEDATAVSFRAEGQTFTAASRQAIAMSASKAEGETVQTDLSLWRYYAHPDGAEYWSLATPGLEVVRHYNPGLRSRASFGGGWHILVPYRLGDGAGAALVPGARVKSISVINQLSGNRDVLSSTDGASFTPDEPDYALAARLTRLPKGWKLTDKIGCEFYFDAEGDLLRMVLRQPDTFKIKGRDGKAVPVKIDGYQVDYRYSRSEPGAPKLLASISQGGETAVLSWSAQTKPRLQHIKATQGGEASGEVSFGYDQTGRLSRVAPSGGIVASVQYNIENNQITVRHLYGEKE